MNPVGRLLYPVLLFFFISACQAKYERRLNRGLPDEGLPLTMVEINSIVASLKKRSDALKTISSLTKVSVSDSVNKNTIKQVLIAKKNSFLRLEYLNIFNQPIMLFLSDYSTFKLYYPSKNTLVLGKATEKNIRDLLGIDVRLSDLFYMLSGNIKFPEENIKHIEAKTIGDTVFLKVEYSKMLILLSIEHGSNVIINRVDKFISGRKVLGIRYDKYENVDEYMFPYFVSVRFPLQGKRLAVHYKKLTINKELRKGIRRLSLPEKFKKINLDVVTYGEY